MDFKRLKSSNREINSVIALDFYKQPKIKELFEALEANFLKCEDNIQKFDEADKKDTYLNGYKLDINSTAGISPSLHLVRDKSSECYNPFNDIYTYRRICKE